MSCWSVRGLSPPCAWPSSWLVLVERSFGSVLFIPMRRSLFGHTSFSDANERVLPQAISLLTRRPGSVGPRS
jgi:hypothetical protein